MQRSTVAIITVIALVASTTTAYAFTSDIQSQTLQVSAQRGALFQVSTYNTLQAGDYNGETTLQDLRAHGDFGLGTFDALNGEMVLLNGTFYQIKSDGTVSVANDSMKTPFADVTFFEPDSQLVLASRSPFPPEQLMPYPPLVDALKNQSIFGLHNVTGTFVGFFAPQYASGICVAGWHFHFLTTDDEHGGHVLDVTLQNATIQIDDLTALSVALPTTSSFYALNLSNDT